MAETVENSNKDVNAQADELVREFVDSLSDEQKMLVALKAQLYDGSWIVMLDDLRNRLNGKPYIFKLASRIQDDIERIERMAEFEKEYNLDLADLVDMP